MYKLVSVAIVFGCLGWLAGLYAAPKEKQVSHPVPYAVPYVTPCPSPLVPAKKATVKPKATVLQLPARPAKAPSAPTDVRIVAPVPSTPTLPVTSEIPMPAPRVQVTESGVVVRIIKPAIENCAGQTKRPDSYGPCPDWQRTTMQFQSPGGGDASAAASDSAGTGASSPGCGPGGGAGGGGAGGGPGSR